MTTEKPIKDMSLEELQKAEPIMFPKPIHMLTDKELSAKVENVFDYLHHMPSDLSLDDEELLKEMKRRFDKTLTDDKQLLGEFDTPRIDLGHSVHFGSGTDINDLNEALYVVILDPRKYPTPDSQFLYLSEQLHSHGASFIARVGLIDTLKSLYDLEGIVNLTPNNQNIIIYWLKNNKVIWGYTLAQDSGDSKAIREIIANSICNLPMGKV